MGAFHLALHLPRVYHEEAYLYKNSCSETPKLFNSPLSIGIGIEEKNKGLSSHDLQPFDLTHPS